MNSKKILTIVLMMCTFSFLGVSFAKDEASPEYRMAWILTLEGDAINSPESIKNTLDTCREHNYNAVIPVIRRRGRAYYKSDIEPFYNPDPEKPLTFDPLAEFIKTAHDTSGGKQKIEVHAWVVVSPVWMEAKSPPAGHVLLKHPNWMTLNYKEGWTEDTPQSWLDPGIPAVEDYLVSVCVEIAGKYEIDGLNLDYIRYREGGFGYNPIALKRFQERYNRTDRPEPTDKQWMEWRQEQVTNLVRRIYVETKKVRPDLKLSACTIVWGSPEPGFENTRAFTDVAQDWVSWMKEGIVDINIPMNYKRESRPEQKKDYRDWVKFMVANKNQGLCISGVGAYLNPISASIDQMKDARELGADGSCIFRLTVNNSDDKPWVELLKAAKESLYAMPAPVAKTVPFTKRDTGILCGILTTMKGPIDSALVKLSNDKGNSYTARTSGTGYFAFCNVQPGTYSMKSDEYGSLIESVKIKKGEIETQNVRVTYEN